MNKEGMEMKNREGKMSSFISIFSKKSVRRFRNEGQKKNREREREGEKELMREK